MKLIVACGAVLMLSVSAWAAPSFISGTGNATNPSADVTLTDAGNFAGDVDHNQMLISAFTANDSPVTIEISVSPTFTGVRAWTLWTGLQQSGGGGYSISVTSFQLVGAGGTFTYGAINQTLVFAGTGAATLSTPQNSVANFLAGTEIASNYAVGGAFVNGTTVVTSIVIELTKSGGSDGGNTNRQFQFDAITSPEPGTLALFGLGAAGFGALALRRRRARAIAKRS